MIIRRGKRNLLPTRFSSRQTIISEHVRCDEIARLNYAPKTFEFLSFINDFLNYMNKIFKKIISKRFSSEIRYF